MMMKVHIASGLGIHAHAAEVFIWQNAFHAPLPQKNSAKLQMELFAVKIQGNASKTLLQQTMYAAIKTSIRIGGFPQHIQYAQTAHAAPGSLHSRHTQLNAQNAASRMK